MTAPGKPTSVLAFAVDAGPTRWGCATVRLDMGAGTLQIVEGAHRVVNPFSDVDLLWLRARIEEVRDAGGLVIAEWIIGWAYEASRVQALVETSRMEGFLLGMSRILGARHVHHAAGDVRSSLVQDKAASDARVAIVVEWIYGRSVRARFNEPERPHVYDAALLAAFGLAREMGFRISLPGAIVAQLMQTKAAEDANSKRLRGEREMAEPTRKLLEAMAKVGHAPHVDHIRAKLGISQEAAIAALRVVGRGRTDAAKVARTMLAVLGLNTTDPAKKRSLTRTQRGRRSAAQKARHAVA